MIVFHRSITLHCGLAAGEQKFSARGRNFMHAKTIDTRPLFLPRGLGTKLVHASSFVFLVLRPLLHMYVPCVHGAYSVHVYT